MKRIVLVSLFLLGITSVTNGQTNRQSVNKPDSLEVMKAVEKIFKNFEKPDYRNFEKIAATEIYCILCEGTKDSKLGPYIIKRKKFFDQYLNSIKSYESWNRAIKSDKILLIKENNDRSFITVLFTTWNENEYALGHEGEQLGLYFRKIKGEYKFSGIETIP